MDVFRKVLEALRYAHAQGVVHRDLKPANILLGPMGEVFVLDWGIARRVREPEVARKGAAALPTGTSALQTQAGAILGTPHYMAPEQAKGEPVDARSDLFSLCLTMWEFMVGSHPWGELENVAQVLQAAIEKPVPNAYFAKGCPNQAAVPADIAWILDKGLQKDPAKRFQSADEALLRLDERSMGKVPIQCPVTFTKRAGYEVLRVVQAAPLPVMAVVTLGLGVLVWRAVR
jgi:serine/threonine-protein kinase